MIYTPIFPAQFQCTTCQSIVQDQVGHDAFHAQYQLIPVPAPPAPTPVPTPVPVPPVVASPPAPPTGVVALVTGNKVALAWVNGSDPLLGGNDVYRNGAKVAYLGFPSPVQGGWTDTNQAPGNVGTPAGTGLAPGTYTYQVSAYSVNGEGPKGAPVTVTISSTPVVGPPVSPQIAGNAARATAGVHADNNIYEAAPYDRNSSAAAFARGATFAGFTQANPPAWNMLECTPDLNVHAGIVSDLASNPNGNFVSGVRGFPTPRMCFTIYGTYTNPAANCAQVAAGAADQALTYLFMQMNKVNWPQIAIRWGWEVDGGWFPWGANPAAYVAAFKHVRDLGNATLTLAKQPKGVLWEWNAFAIRGAPNAKNSYGFTTMDYWPGKQSVDVIGCDTYRVNNDGNDTVWLNTAKAAAAFAVSQGLQVGYSEVGCWDSYQGSPATLEASGASVRAWTAFLALCDSFPPGLLAYHMAFDGNPGTGLFSWNYYPKALAVYKQRMLLP